MDLIKALDSYRLDNKITQQALADKKRLQTKLTGLFLIGSNQNAYSTSPNVALKWLSRKANKTRKTGLMRS
jgi:hypothetical protein